MILREVAVGVAPEGHQLNACFPGKEVRLVFLLVAYCSSWCLTTAQDVYFGPKYVAHRVRIADRIKVGDVIGCGVCGDAVYWTLNGILVIKCVAAKQISGKLRPAVGANTPVKLRVDFKPAVANLFGFGFLLMVGICRIWSIRLFLVLFRILCIRRVWLRSCWVSGGRSFLSS